MYQVLAYICLVKSRVATSNKLSRVETDRRSFYDLRRCPSLAANSRADRIGVNPIRFRKRVGVLRTLRPAFSFTVKLVLRRTWRD